MSDLDPKDLKKRHLDSLSDEPGGENNEERELSPVERLHDAWPSLSEEQRLEHFREIERLDAEELFLNLSAQDQASLIRHFPRAAQRSWVRLLPPDDAADLIQEIPEDERYDVLSLIDTKTAKEVTALMAYAEDDAGGLMNSRFARLRPDMTVEEALSYLRIQAIGNHVETIRYAYVLDHEQKLHGVVSLRQLFSSSPGQKIIDIMEEDVVSVPEEMDQEEVSRIISNHGFMALPVVDHDRRMKGLITIDDIVEVVEEEATEDIQKLGGQDILSAPYLRVSYFELLKKRVGWLVILFLGGMLTASALGFYESEIEKAVVLTLFIPLIISSGGNSGTQACTLIIRAIALREVRLRDWWRVLTRETFMGLSLGLILGFVGVLRVVLWPERTSVYGEHYLLLGLTVGLSILGVVLWGTLVGSMLPFVLRRFNLDPATASAPFVATLVDVVGLVIYFVLANLILGGTLLS